MATIFLSHSSRDDALASALVQWLTQKGFDDIFVDHSSIRSGDKWTEALRRAKGSCRIVLCLVSATWLNSAECFGEFTAGWYAGRRMIPLLCLAGAELNGTQKLRLSRVLLEDQGVDLCAAGAPLSLDLDAHPQVAGPFIEGLRAAGALAKIGLDPSVFPIDDRRDSEANLIKPPFPGLESFGDTDADAAIFYGRSSEIAQVIEDLREFRANGDIRAYADTGRAYVIQGASGSGKSSLLKAGVLPRLRRERGWVALRSFRPGPDPLLHLAEALVKPLDGYKLDQAPGVLRDRLLTSWRDAVSIWIKFRASLPEIVVGDARKQALHEARMTMLSQLRKQLDAVISPVRIALDRPYATTLISIDQSEELVRAEGESGDATADYLKAALLPAPPDQPAHYAIAMTVRTDSFPELQNSIRFEGLATELFDLRPLPIYRFDAAIEQPALRYGAEIEPQLVELLMDDAGGKDLLPLLAFTLQRLWRQYEAERRIRAVNYESVGKLLGIIEDAAERALRGIDPSARQAPLTPNASTKKDAAARRVFLPHLAQVNERGGTTRRVATLANFDDEAIDIINSYEKWRLVVTSGESVEVAHEALFRAWPRFIRWLEPEKARLETLRGLESAALSWDSHSQAFDFVTHYGKRLRDALRLLRHSEFKNHIARQAHVRAYLRAATVLDRGLRIANWYTFGLVIIGFLCVMGGLIWATFTGNQKLLPLLAISFGTFVVVYPISILLTYLSVFLRRFALRSGWYSDIVVLFLTGLVLGGVSFLLLRRIGNSDVAEVGGAMREQWSRQPGTEFFYHGIDDPTIGKVMMLQSLVYGSLFPPLIWALSNSVSAILVPVSWLMKKVGIYGRRPSLAGSTGDAPSSQPANIARAAKLSTAVAHGS